MARRLVTAIWVIAASAHAETPALMREAAFGTEARMKELIATGADVNEAATDGATALHWAVQDAAKVTLLLAKGAKPDIRTKSNRTPLLVAARSGPLESVRLLLAAGADPGESLGESVGRGDTDVLKLLLAHNPTQAARNNALRTAAGQGCLPCAELLVAAGAAVPKGSAVLRNAAQRGNVAMVPLLAKLGADPNVADAEGYTALHRAAHRDSPDAELVKALLAVGARWDATTKAGDTVLSLAARHGDGPVTALLRGVGAPPGPSEPAAPNPKGAPDVDTGVARSLPLLQKCGPEVVKLRGCVSCHNNSLPMVVVAMARKGGFAVDEEGAAKAVKSNAGLTLGRVQQMMLGTGVPGADDTATYILWSLAESGYPANAATEASVHYLSGRQRADGSWHTGNHRPPQEYSDITVTALAIGGMRHYPREDTTERIARAAKWLAAQKTDFLEDRAMKLLGLGWSGVATADTRADLLATQRADGGWSQTPSLASDAYGSGLALFSLHVGGGLASSDKAYQRGVRFLLRNQQADGSWYVRSRSLPFQPYFESGFPHGHDQWISAAGSSWATMALMLTRNPVR